MPKLFRWDPMKRATKVDPPSRELIEIIVKDYKVTEAEALAIIEKEHRSTEYWVNEMYQVQVRRFGKTKLVQLNIRRRDGGVILRDWRHFQRIKNEILGPEIEAVELYPAESRKVDATNKYHLWAVEKSGYRFPFGMDERDVNYVGGKMPGLRQRPAQYEDEL